MPTCFRVLKWLAMKTKGIGYVRVSTDKQADRGVSLEAQVEKIKAMATVHDVELLDVLVDAGESAKDLPRVRGPWLQHRGRETGFPSIGPPTAGRAGPFSGMPTSTECVHHYCATLASCGLVISFNGGLSYCPPS